MSPRGIKQLRARSREEIVPLIDLCKKGRLFEVQNWIAEGKPVNLPCDDPKGRRLHSPLEIAIDMGFHSLVAVLLDGGAIQEPDGWGSPIHMAIRQKRRDLIELLVAHGLNMAEVDMREVFETWEPALMEYFINQGADPESGNPLAAALCDRIRTALNIYKKYKDRFPSFQEQANIALRHHSIEGNLKWVSLMLWAGADPYAPGTSSWDEQPDEGYEGYSAVRNAAVYDKAEVFDLLTKKGFDPARPELIEIMHYAFSDQNVAMIVKLLDRGVDLTAHAKEAADALNSHLSSLPYTGSFYNSGPESRRDIDNDRARNHMKALHILAKNGARWMPTANNIASARRSLLKMKSGYAMEFIWIMSKYKACKRSDLEELLRTGSIRGHLGMHTPRIDRLLDELEPLGDREGAHD